MMECGKCKEWIHAHCEAIDEDHYQILSFLPDTVEYVCKKCLPDKKAPWLETVQNTFYSNIQYVLKTLLSSKWSKPIRYSANKMTFQSKSCIENNIKCFKEDTAASLDKFGMHKDILSEPLSVAEESFKLSKECNSANVDLNIALKQYDEQTILQGHLLSSNAPYKICSSNAITVSQVNKKHMKESLYFDSNMKAVLEDAAPQIKQDNATLEDNVTPVEKIIPAESKPAFCLKVGHNSSLVMNDTLPSEYHNIQSYVKCSDIYSSCLKKTENACDSICPLEKNIESRSFADIDELASMVMFHDTDVINTASCCNHLKNAMICKNILNNEELDKQDDPKTIRVTKSKSLNSNACEILHNSIYVENDLNKSAGEKDFKDSNVLGSVVSSEQCKSIKNIRSCKSILNNEELTENMRITRSKVLKASAPDSINLRKCSVPLLDVFKNFKHTEIKNGDVYLATCIETNLKKNSMLKDCQQSNSGTSTRLECTDEIFNKETNLGNSAEVGYVNEVNYDNEYRKHALLKNSHHFSDLNDINQFVHSKEMCSQGTSSDIVAAFDCINHAETQSKKETGIDSNSENKWTCNVNKTAKYSSNESVLPIYRSCDTSNFQNSLLQKGRLDVYHQLDQESTSNYDQAKLNVSINSSTDLSFNTFSSVKPVNEVTNNFYLTDQITVNSNFTTNYESKFPVTSSSELNLEVSNDEVTDASQFIQVCINKDIDDDCLSSDSSSVCDSETDLDSVEDDSPIDLMSVLDRVKNFKYNSLVHFHVDVNRILCDKSRLTKYQMKKLHSMYTKCCQEKFPWFQIKNCDIFQLVNSNDHFPVPYVDHTYSQKNKSEPLFYKKQDNNNSNEKFCFPDSRKCSLCSKERDDKSNLAGRLLYLGQDEWVHVNCILWSSEVYEEIDGSLENVYEAITRGRQIKCTHCHERGATLGCCYKTCQATYHFMCAINVKCFFMEDRTMYCPLHESETHTKKLLEDLKVSRCVFVNMNCEKKKWKPLMNTNIRVVIGSLIIHKLGKIYPDLDTGDALIPAGFVCSRLFWSTKDPTRKVRYTVQTRYVVPPLNDDDVISESLCHCTINHSDSEETMMKLKEVELWKNKIDCFNIEKKVFISNVIPPHLCPMYQKILQEEQNVFFSENTGFLVDEVELSVRQCLDELIEKVCNSLDDETFLLDSELPCIIDLDNDFISMILSDIDNDNINEGAEANFSNCFEAPDLRLTDNCIDSNNYCSENDIISLENCVNEETEECSHLLKVDKIIENVCPRAAETLPYLRNPLSISTEAFVDDSSQNTMTCKFSSSSETPLSFSCLNGLMPEVSTTFLSNNHVGITSTNGLPASIINYETTTTDISALSLASNACKIDPCFNAHSANSVSDKQLHSNNINLSDSVSTVSEGISCSNRQVCKVSPMPSIVREVATSGSLENNDQAKDSLIQAQEEHEILDRKKFRMKRNYKTVIKKYPLRSSHKKNKPYETVQIEINETIEYPDDEPSGSCYVRKHKWAEKSYSGCKFAKKRRKVNKMPSHSEPNSNMPVSKKILKFIDKSSDITVSIVDNNNLCSFKNSKMKQKKYKHKTVLQVDGAADELSTDITTSDTCDTETEKLSKEKTLLHQPANTQLAMKIKAQSLARSVPGEEGPFKCLKCRRLYRTKESYDIHVGTCTFELDSSTTSEDDDVSQCSIVGVPIASKESTCQLKNLDLSNKNCLSNNTKRMAQSLSQDIAEASNSETACQLKEVTSDENSNIKNIVKQRIQKNIHPQVRTAVKKSTHPKKDLISETISIPLASGDVFVPPSFSPPKCSNIFKKSYSPKKYSNVRLPQGHRGYQYRRSYSNSRLIDLPVNNNGNSTTLPHILPNTSTQQLFTPPGTPVTYSFTAIQYTNQPEANIQPLPISNNLSPVFPSQILSVVSAPKVAVPQGFAVQYMGSYSDNSAIGQSSGGLLAYQTPQILVPQSPIIIPSHPNPPVVPQIINTDFAYAFSPSETVVVTPTPPPPTVVQPINYVQEQQVQAAMPSLPTRVSMQPCDYKDYQEFISCSDTFSSASPSVSLDIQPHFVDESMNNEIISCSNIYSDTSHTLSFDVPKTDIQTESTFKVAPLITTAIATTSTVTDKHLNDTSACTSITTKTVTSCSEKENFQASVYLSQKTSVGSSVTIPASTFVKKRPQASVAPHIISPNKISTMPVSTPACSLSNSSLLFSKSFSTVSHSIATVAPTVFSSSTSVNSISYSYAASPKIATVKPRPSFSYRDALLKEQMERNKVRQELFKKERQHLNLLENSCKEPENAKKDYQKTKCGSDTDSDGDESGTTETQSYKLVLRKNKLESGYTVLPVQGSSPLPLNPEVKELRIKAKVSVGPKKKKRTQDNVFYSSSDLTGNLMVNEQEANFTPNNLKNTFEDSSIFEKPKNTEPYIIFELTSEDGFKVESRHISDVWKKVYEAVDNARSSLQTDSKGSADSEQQNVLSGLQMLGLTHSAVKYLLEQLPGAEDCHRYSFQFHRRPQDESKLAENPTGCARTEPFKTRSPYDIFSWLASKHRHLPERSFVSPEELQLSSIRRATSLELPMAMRYRHIKDTAREAVGVFRSSIHGRGLFCKRDIDAGEMVIEYAGQLIRSSLCDIREKFYESKGIGCYMFKICDDTVIDATMHGNAARFINHSCDPNCYSRVVDILGKKHIIIFALRKIFCGEELTYDYKFPFEEDKIPCTCGARRCRKYLN